jgi:hypothetical protein
MCSQVARHKSRIGDGQGMLLSVCASGHVDVHTTGICIHKQMAGKGSAKHVRASCEASAASCVARGMFLLHAIMAALATALMVPIAPTRAPYPQAKRCCSIILTHR